MGGGKGEGVYSVCAWPNDHRPSHPYYAGTKHVPGFHQPGRHCVGHARSAVRCSTSPMKGELHPTKNHLWGEPPHFLRFFLRMNDSLECTNLFSGVAISRYCNGDIRKLPRGFLTLCALRYTISFVCLHPAQYVRTPPPPRLPPNLGLEGERYPCGLAYVVRGVFFTVVANRRHPKQGGARAGASPSTKACLGFQNVS